MNPTYITFLEEVVGHNHDNLLLSHFSNVIEIKNYGRNRDSFREAYNKAAQGIFTTIYHLNNPKTIRIGFIECVEKGSKEDGGWYQIWHTIRIQAWRTGDKRDPKYKFNFAQGLHEDILRLKRSMKKETDTYAPLFVSSLNHESYVYLGDGVQLFMPEYQKARKEWFEADDDVSFHEFLEEIRKERCQMQKKLDKK